MSDHPWPVGTRVSHVSQQWHRSRMGGTAYIVGYDGPYNDGSYEYDVMAGEEFARQTGADNPETRPTRWSSLATVKAERPEPMKSTASAVEFSLMRDMAGPNPKGSHLSADERLHLLYMVTVMNQSTGTMSESARDDILRALDGRQFTPEQLAEVFVKSGTPIEFTDALCVHPSMKFGDGMYLD